MSANDIMLEAVPNVSEGRDESCYRRLRPGARRPRVQPARRPFRRRPQPQRLHARGRAAGARRLARGRGAHGRRPHRHARRTRAPIRASARSTSSRSPTCARTTASWPRTRRLPSPTAGGGARPAGVPLWGAGERGPAARAGVLPRRRRGGARARVWRSGELAPGLRARRGCTRPRARRSSAPARRWSRSTSSWTPTTSTSRSRSRPRCGRRTADCPACGRSACSSRPAVWPGLHERARPVRGPLARRRGGGARPGRTHWGHPWPRRSWSGLRPRPRSTAFPPDVELRGFDEHRHMLENRMPARGAYDSRHGAAKAEEAPRHPGRDRASRPPVAAAHSRPGPPAVRAAPPAKSRTSRPTWRGAITPRRDRGRQPLRAARAAPGRSGRRSGQARSAGRRALHAGIPRDRHVRVPPPDRPNLNKPEKHQMKSGFPSRKSRWQQGGH